MSRYYVFNGRGLIFQVLGDYDNYAAAVAKAEESYGDTSKEWKVVDEYQALDIASQIIACVKRGKA